MHNIDFKNILDIITSSCTEIFRDNLTGIYVHGSIAMGCATRNSDMDLLIILKQPDTIVKYSIFIEKIMNIREAPQKGIELSMVLKKYCDAFKYPTPFELHYSDEHRSRYENDKSYICGNGYDKDLAAHFMVTKNRGICLYGEPIDTLFPAIPNDIYLDSVFYDLSDAHEGILTDTVYHVLNLCRTLGYVKDNCIRSKLEGGQWAASNIEKKFLPVINHAIAIYSNNASNNTFSKHLLADFCEYMNKEILIACNLSDNKLVESDF